MAISVIILAAGQSTRMRSKLPKVVHPIAGRPMIWYGVHLAQALLGDDGRPVLVVGHQAERVQAVVGDAAEYVLQHEQKGTGHAVMMARELVEPRQGTVMVYYGDMPLLREETLQDLLRVHEARRHETPLTMLTVRSHEAMGFGRVVRDAAGRILEVVEEAVATEEQKAITELNCGVYCFESAWLWPRLSRIPLSSKGEYYLTDLVGMAAAEGHTVASSAIDDTAEVLGINTRVHLACAEAEMRRRINEQWMLAGVTIIDPAATYIEADVKIGPDTVIYPDTHVRGQTHIGEDCHIGPNSYIADSRIGDRCRVFASVLEGAVVEDDVDIGPFGHLRQGAHLAQGVHMGNFGEVKNAYLGPGTKMGHFSYIGDAEIGSRVNIGAGTITCNFDGTRKHKTLIEDDVFIGSDTLLVAPVRVGRGAVTGAGSVVAKGEVPPDAVVYGVPARVRRFRSEKEKPADSSSTGQVDK